MLDMFEMCVSIARSRRNILLSPPHPPKKEVGVRVHHGSKMEQLNIPMLRPKVVPRKNSWRGI